MTTTPQPTDGAIAEIRRLICELPLEAQPIGYSINAQLDALVARPAQLGGGVVSDEVVKMLGERINRLERWSDGGQHMRIPGPSAGEAMVLAQELKSVLRALGKGGR